MMDNGVFFKCIVDYGLWILFVVFDLIDLLVGLMLDLGIGYGFIGMVFVY